MREFVLRLLALAYKCHKNQLQQCRMKESHAFATCFPSSSPSECAHSLRLCNVLLVCVWRLTLSSWFVFFCIVVLKSSFSCVLHKCAAGFQEGSKLRGCQANCILPLLRRGEEKAPWQHRKRCHHCYPERLALNARSPKVQI